MNSPNPDFPPLDRRDLASASDSGQRSWGFDDHPSAGAAHGAESTPEEVASWLEEADLEPPISRRSRFPGPGILESVVWAAGFMFTQLITSLLLFGFLAISFLWAGGAIELSPLAPPSITHPEPPVTPSPLTDPERPAGRPDLPVIAELAPPTTPSTATTTESDPTEVASGTASPLDDSGDATPVLNNSGPPWMRALMQYVEQRMPFMLWGAGLATAIYAVLLCRFRLGLPGVAELGWQLPSGQHLLAIGLLVLPLSLFASSIQAIGFEWWPSSRASMEELFKQMAPLPLPILWLILAFAPAVSEELLFRGVIGRGLLARYGLVPGVLITSLMFGLMHMNPAQIMGTIPIGIAIHYVYRVTRSFWSPMLLHFLNNALAGVMLKLADNATVQKLGDDQGGSQSPLALVLSVACIACLGCWMWQTRREFLDETEREWDPDQPHCGTPPPESPFQWLNRPRFHWVWSAVSVVLLSAMLATLVLPTSTQDVPAPADPGPAAQIPLTHPG